MSRIVMGRPRAGYLPFIAMFIGAALLSWCAMVISPTSTRCCLVSEATYSRTARKYHS